MNSILQNCFLQSIDNRQPQYLAKASNYKGMPSRDCPKRTSSINSNVGNRTSSIGSHYQQNVSMNKIFDFINVNPKRGEEESAFLFDSDTTLHLIKKPNDNIEMSNKHLMGSHDRNVEELSALRYQYPMIARQAYAQGMYQRYFSVHKRTKDSMKGAPKCPKRAMGCIKDPSHLHMIYTTKGP